MKIHINARSGLGDAVYFLSIARTLARHIHPLEMSVIAWNAGVELYGTIPSVTTLINANDLINILGNKWDKTSAKAMMFFEKNIGKPDYYIDLQPHTGYLNENQILDARTKIAINPTSEMHPFYDTVIKTNSGEHILHTYQRMLCEVFNIRDYEPTGNFSTPDFAHETAEKVISVIRQNMKRPLAFIHPGAKAHKKLWNVLNWGVVVNWLIDKKQFQPVLLGSSLRLSGQVPILDIPSAESIQRLSFDRCVYLAGKTDRIPVLTSLISYAHLYIGLDTGPTHIAAVSGIPTLELFWKESNNQFHTWKACGPSVRYIAADSMQDITAEMVINELESWDGFKNISSGNVPGQPE